MKEKVKDANVQTQAIVFGPEDVASCDAWESCEGTKSCIIALTEDYSECGSNHKRAVTTTVKSSLKNDTSVSKAFRAGSAQLRKLLRHGAKGAAPMSMAVMSMSDSKLDMAWSGDIYSLRFRNHAHELIAHPCRAGKRDAFDPLGSSPAICKRRLKDNDLIICCSQSIASSVFQNDKLLRELEDAKTLSEASKATSAACKLHGVKAGACYLAQVRGPRLHYDDLGDNHET